MNVQFFCCGRLYLRIINTMREVQSSLRTTSLFFFFLCVLTFSFTSASHLRSLDDPPNNCFVEDESRTRAWDFSSLAQTQLTAVFAGNSFGAGTFFTLVVSFCSRIDSIYGNISQEANQVQLGWNHGVLDQFTYTGDGTTHSFFQSYSYGDNGPGCQQGRKASLQVYCYACPAEEPEDTEVETPVSGRICTEKYQAEDPCTMYASIALPCPQPFTPGSSTGATSSSPSPPPHHTPGGVVGWVFLSLFIFGCAAFVAIFFYNYKVLGKKGAEAVPGISLVRKAEEKIRSRGNHSKDTGENTPVLSDRAYGTIS